ncbi:hypothetical protein B0H17DRAFT_1157479 [Mycena rosella]|uniref:Mitochondrial carrier protein n=1 Tax=Mycena rosella TaxID=1033263 RepID=A0AAD7GR92_MYCRO|nr:hypothetical protein B0H17DRAFT_1157479 [Mycena rosella]
MYLLKFIICVGKKGILQRIGHVRRVNWKTGSKERLSPAAALNAFHGIQFLQIESKISGQLFTNLLQAAVARTATRAVALYFSRPVRLFRPSKVSGWHSLRGLAARDGASLTPSFVSSLVKTQGFMVIPKHFFPPMVVNALLGTILWTSYAEASAVLQPHMGAHPTTMAALAGALAGGTQALVSAPAENVRLLVEGGSSSGSSRNSWLHAWKEVFRGTPRPTSASRQETIQEIRQMRSWMREVGDMAGRGWHGLGYTFGKDLTGFAAFFAIFEVTRRIALKIKALSQDAMRSVESGSGQGKSFRNHVPQLANGVTLVTGGVVAGLSYEVIGRPWEVARQAVRLRVVTSQEYRSPLVLIARKIQQEGFLCLFRDSTVVNSPPVAGSYRRIYSVLRTLARVGPWGLAFLIFQAYDSGPG